MLSAELERELLASVLSVLGGGVGVDVGRSHELNVPSVKVRADVDVEETGTGVYGG